jgi:hypothetical protein
MTLQLVGDPDDGKPQGDPSAIPGHFLTTARRVFRRWFGAKYDLRVLDAVLCTAAAQRLGGDPCWLLVVGGPGAAKTETIMALCGTGAVMVSTITGEAALLSGTSEKDRAPDATGGLLGKIGPEGVMVIKDVTTIISMSRESRAQVLAALREIYDGKWNREVGTDGGRTLSWEGSLVVIGAVTTAWDAAHAVISSMGDRFVLIRIDSTENRREAGLQALMNVSHEKEMRDALAAAVTAAITAVPKDATVTLTIEEMNELLDLADVVTLTRTAVERDFQGNVVQAHAPEMPTRFLKQLGQIMRGGIALGMDRAEALDVAVRCAGDSMPPMRLAVLGDVLNHPGTLYSDTSKRLQLPRKSIDRVMQELHLLGLLVTEGVTYGQGERVTYSIAPTINASALGKLARNGGPSSQGDDKDAPKMARNGGETPQGGDANVARNGGTPPEAPTSPVTAVAVTGQSAVTVLTSEVTAVTAVTPNTALVHEGQLQVPGTPPPEPAEKPVKPVRRKCENCKAAMPKGARADARFCKPSCRNAVWAREKRKKAKETS